MASKIWHNILFSPPILFFPLSISYSFNKLIQWSCLVKAYRKDFSFSLLGWTIKRNLDNVKKDDMIYKVRGQFFSPSGTLICASA